MMRYVYLECALTAHYIRFYSQARHTLYTQSIAQQVSTLSDLFVPKWSRRFSNASWVYKLLKSIYLHAGIHVMWLNTT